MTAFRSDEELFQAVRELTARLTAGGHQRAADELNGGFGCLNGLTDGWALFLESIDRLRDGASGPVPAEERETLNGIRASVSKALRRRRDVTPRGAAPLAALHSAVCTPGRAPAIQGDLLP